MKMQPIQIVGDVCRFKPNSIVEYLLDNGQISLNQLAGMNFPQHDWEQFYQLIGYSISGYHELSNVSDESALQASKVTRETHNLDSGKIVGCRDQNCAIHCGVAKETVS